MDLPFTPESAAEAVRHLWREEARREDSSPEKLASFKNDPLGFVKWAYPWGRSGELRNAIGPDTWQTEMLTEIGEQVKARAFDGHTTVTPLRFAVSSGHGCGKSVLTAWLVDWIKSTRPYSQGTVTANTWPQLETKTWATITKWNRISRTAGDFLIGSGSIKHKIYGKSWHCTPQTCREENSESFAGQHAATSTSYYIFDESSNISEKIWEVAEGGLTDGEPMIFVFGNPTRSSGKFFQVVFGKDSARWNTRIIDSRTCAMPNKKTIEEWEQDHGENSDFFRVRVRGLPPNAGDLQFIDSDRVYAAQKREVIVLPDEPLIAGVDLARGGGDDAVIYFRRGDDARTIPPVRIKPEDTRDSTRLIAKLADLASQKFGPDKVSVHTWFLDGGGIGGPIIDRLKQIGHNNMIEIQFSGRCPDDKHYRNMRAWMWAKMREWLGNRGAISPKDQILETDLTNVGLKNRGDIEKITLEPKEDMKKRGLRSPDNADSLCLTFARYVAPLNLKDYKAKQPGASIASPFLSSGSTNAGWMES